jgi:hypothetical protein
MTFDRYSICYLFYGFLTTLVDSLQKEASADNLSPAMGARNQVGIGLLYRPASLCSLATQFQTRFLESIPRPIAGLKIPTLGSGSDLCCPVHWWGEGACGSVRTARHGGSGHKN